MNPFLPPSLHRGYPQGGEWQYVICQCSATEQRGKSYLTEDGTATGTGWKDPTHRASSSSQPLLTCLHLTLLHRAGGDGPISRFPPSLQRG